MLLSNCILFLVLLLPFVFAFLSSELLGRDISLCFYFFLCLTMACKTFFPNTPLRKYINLTMSKDYFFMFYLFIFYKFIYLFLATLGLCCCTQAFSSCSKRGLLFLAVCGLLCSGFSCCGARAPGTRASVVAARGLSSCGSQALECRLSSCGSRAQLLCSMWDLPGPGLEPVSPALEGGFLTTAP